MVFAILFLLTLVDLSASLVTNFDPSGWNTYFATEHSDNVDAVDVVDPSGWNYNRGTKSFERNNDIKIDQAQQVLTFCQRVVEQGSSEINPTIEDVIGTAVKAKVTKIFNNKEDLNGNLVFIRRFISILLNTADLTNKVVKEGSDLDVSGVIEIRVSPEHLKILTDFTNSETNVSMRELDSILSTSVHRKYISTFRVFESIENVFFYFRQEIWLRVMLAFIMLFVCRLLLISNSKTRLCTSLLFLIFTVSYVVEYYRMYKEVEIKQKIILDKHTEIPSACYPRNQQWWSTLFKSLGFVEDERQECMEYHKALLLDPLVEVSPSRVLSNILSDFVLNPAGKVGEAIAAFTSGILGGLPIWYGWIVWLVSFLGVFILIALVLVILIGRRIQLFGPFFGVSVSSHQPPEVLPPAAPAVSATSVTRSTSQPILEAVSGNFVLMDADSLGALFLRAQTSVTTVHSGVQELNIPPEKSVPLKSSNEKSNGNTAQQRITERKESDLKTSNEKQLKNEDIALDEEKTCELKSLDHEQVEVYDTSSVLDDTTESKSGNVNIEKHPENVKKDN